jgi:integral membrane protein (TIGR00529 family)
MSFALGLLVGLLRFKVKIGRSMIISAFALAVFLGVTPTAMWRELVTEWQDKPLAETTGYLLVTITALVLLVNVISSAMKQTGVTDRLVPAMQGLVASRRLALSMIPLLMGLLPSPGGIMLSAPMVRDLGDRLCVERSRLAAINFYFPHQWEPVWPLFPAIPLIQGYLGVSVQSIILYNGVVILAGLIGGVIFLLLRGIPPKKDEHKPNKALFHHNLRDFLHAFWPIALAAALYAAFNLPPAAGIFIAIIAFLLLHKIPLKRWTGIFKTGKEMDLTLLILGALLFRLILLAGNAVSEVVDVFNRYNVPPNVIIFLLPFLVSFLTGITSVTVAITFPLLAPMIGTGAEAKMPLEALAISGLVCGLCVTPVHLCLALSAGYFETTFIKIVTKLILPILFVVAAGVLMAIYLT